VGFLKGTFVLAVLDDLKYAGLDTSFEEVAKIIRSSSDQQEYPVSCEVLDTLQHHGIRVRLYGTGGDPLVITIPWHEVVAVVELDPEQARRVGFRA
jgi:hypothetical protein